MKIKFEYIGRRFRKKVRMEVIYIRDFVDDYIIKKVFVLDENGK